MEFTVKATTLSIYSSHDSSVSFLDPNGNYRIYELERMTGQRYFKLNNDLDKMREVLMQLKSIITREYPGIKFHKCLFGKVVPSGFEAEMKIIKQVFGISKFQAMQHHPSHAAGAFKLSGFDRAVILSFDGGGFNRKNQAQMFCVYKAQAGKYIKLFESALDLGGGYSLMALPISEVNKQGQSMSYPGKLMAMAAYGTIKKEWIKPIDEYYTKMSHLQNESKLHALGEMLGIDLTENSVSGQVAYDLAATNQKVFEDIAFEQLNKIINEHGLHGWPICLTGGCALNILFCQKLINDGFDVFVPPNPSDCGLSFGQLMLKQPPNHVPDITYSGFGILDDTLDNGTNVTAYDIAKLIKDGKIIGIVQGNSEVGPRALGNRSILCDPGIKDVKDILNSKIKFREFFRPFAPIVKAESAQIYFNMRGKQSPYMSFAQEVHDEWKQKLQSIVHKDGTARVQTVTVEQNKLLYDILTEFERLSGYAVLLNTSFNTKGKPMLLTVKQALQILHDTQLDHVVILDKHKNLKLICK